MTVSTFPAPAKKGRAQMTDHEKMADDIEKLRDEVQALRKDVQDLVDAWRTANGVVRFVRWLSSAVVAVGILWVATKGLPK